MLDRTNFFAPDEPPTGGPGDAPPDVAFAARGDDMTALPELDVSGNAQPGAGQSDRTDDDGGRDAQGDASPAGPWTVDGATRRRVRADTPPRGRVGRRRAAVFVALGSRRARRLGAALALGATLAVTRSRDRRRLGRRGRPGRQRRRPQRPAGD